MKLKASEAVLRSCFTKQSFRGCFLLPRFASDAVKKERYSRPAICRGCLHRLLTCKDYRPRHHADEKRTGQDEHHQANRMWRRLKPPHLSGQESPVAAVHMHLDPASLPVTIH